MSLDRSDAVGLSACLLRGHEGQRPSRRTGLAVGPGMAPSGHAEIDQPRPARLVEQDVLGLDVLVHHAATVRVLERPGNLGHPGRRLSCRRQRLLGDLLEVAAPHELHRDERAAFVDIEVVDPHEVGMVQLAEDLRVAPQQAAVDRGRLVGDLDRQVARQGRVHRAIDRRLAARIELADDSISADALGPERGLCSGPGWSELSSVDSVPDGQVAVAASVERPWSIRHWPLRAHSSATWRTAETSARKRSTRSRQAPHAST